jgi:cysteine desulfurase
VLLGAVRAAPGARLVVSAIEHPGLLALARRLKAEGVAVDELLVDRRGVIDLAAAQRLIRPGVALVSVMAANNETGVLQPLPALASLCREAGAWLHSDLTQALGKTALTLDGLDLASCSAHKIGGPQGVGVLWHRAGAPLKALQYGGGQERGLRSGTENVAGIAGFGAAAETAVRDLPKYAALANPRDAMEARLKAEGGVTVIGEGSPRLAGTSNFARPGFRAETQVMALDLAGVCVSAGSACSSGKVKRSLVLLAMGADDALAESAIRTSFGWDTKPEDFERVADAWLEAARRTVLKETV